MPNNTQDKDAATELERVQSDLAKAHEDKARAERDIHRLNKRVELLTPRETDLDRSRRNQEHIERAIRADTERRRAEASAARERDAALKALMAPPAAQADSKKPNEGGK